MADAVTDLTDSWRLAASVRAFNQRKVRSAVVNISEAWNELEPATQQWLLNNPGCVILPRTVATAIAKALHDDAVGDRHGELTLSEEDIDFIWTRARHSASATGHWSRFSASMHRSETVHRGESAEPHVASLAQPEVPAPTVQLPETD